MSIVDLVPRPVTVTPLGTPPVLREDVGRLTGRELVVLANLSEGVTLDEIASSDEGGGGSYDG